MNTEDLRSKLTGIAVALDAAVVAGDLGAVKKGADELRRLLSTTEREVEEKRQEPPNTVDAADGAVDLSVKKLSDFGLFELAIDETYGNVTWITSDHFEHEVWVRSKHGATYLVFALLSQNDSEIAIWVDGRSAEELAAKLHTNCYGWKAREVEGELAQFMVLDNENYIVSVEELAGSDDPRRQAWAERIPILCQQVDNRFQRTLRRLASPTKDV